MTRVEQRTQKLLQQLGNIEDLVSSRSRSEAAEVKRAARVLTSLLKRKTSTQATSAARRSATVAPAKTGHKSTAASKKRGTSRATKDGRSISEVRRAAAHKAWETKRQKAQKG